MQSIQNGLLRDPRYPIFGADSGPDDRGQIPPDVNTLGGSSTLWLEVSLLSMAVERW
jgi:hypothetical protein